MSFKYQIEELLKECKVISEEANPDFELSCIDKNLDSAVDIQTKKTIDKLFEGK